MLSYKGMQKYRTTVNLPKNLYRLAKLKALDEQKTFTQVLEEGLRLLFEKKQVNMSQSLSEFLAQDSTDQTLKSMTDQEIDQEYRSLVERKHGAKNIS
jgi:hypothetical protein